MPWEYSQNSGILRQDGVQVDIGYSGKDYAKNNPDMESLGFMGPIPRGAWRIGPASDTGKGAFTMSLTPIGHSAHGRNAFLIHGDKIGSPGNASEGCIILSRSARMRISASGDASLTVVR